MLQNKKIQLNLDALEDGMFIVSADTFKRLNNKTQVITNSNSYSIRNRLTHSLEVAAIGMYISQNINEQLGFELVNPSTVENIGKIHDIGHSPLGHVGAEVLNEELNKLNLCFEDNANSLVILEKYYPNLSRLAILSTIKYPYILNENKKNKNKGLYKPQKHYLDELATLCYEQSIDKNKVLIRTYESYIMEYADDIAYLTGDLEDLVLHFDGSISSQYLDKIYKELGIETNTFFEEYRKILLSLNKENIEVNTWLFRKNMIKNIYFSVSENNFYLKDDNYIIFQKLLRKITYDLYIDIYSVRPNDDIIKTFRQYIRLLYKNINNNKFLKKEINSKRLRKSIFNTNNLEEKKIFLSNAISEMTDDRLLKRLKTHFFNGKFRDIEYNG